MNNANNVDLLKQKVWDQLKRVKDESGQDLVSLGLIDSVEVDKNSSQIIINVDLVSPANARIASDIRKELSRMGLSNVEVRFPTAQERTTPRADFGVSGQYLVGVKNIIAVASNKGGVGKSTIAANLAVTLAQKGFKVGIQDVDIYGPNIPRLFGKKNLRVKKTDNKYMPVMVDVGGKHPLGIMSSGFVLPENDEDTPIIWRAPLVFKMMREFFEDVQWGDLDYLVIDLPPGTGDIQLNVVELLPQTRVIFVSTPAAMSIADVSRGILMFQSMGVHILGIIENMSVFRCPDCDTEYYVFSKKKTEALAQRFNLPILASIPLDPQIRKLGDEGRPLVLAHPSHYFTDIMKLIADYVTNENNGENIKRFINQAGA